MRRTRGRGRSRAARFGPAHGGRWASSTLLAASLVLAAASGGSRVGAFVFLGAFTYGIVYTVWLKRRSAWNIVVGGLAGSFAVLAGAAAVDPAPQVVPVVLAIVLFLWTPPHFWSLAAAKGEDYAKAGVPMLPIVVPAHAWTIAILTHTVALVAISLVPLWFGQGLIYGLGAGSGGAIFLVEEHRAVPHADQADRNGELLCLAAATLLVDSRGRARTCRRVMAMTRLAVQGLVAAILLVGTGAGR